MWQTIKSGLILLGKVIVLTVLVAIYAAVCYHANAEQNNQKTWVKGSVVIGITVEGRCLFKPFIKVDDTSDDPDTGKPQILGYEPGNVYIDRHGRVVWERVDEESFIPLGRFKTVHGRMCKCPPYNE